MPTTKKFDMQIANAEKKYLNQIYWNKNGFVQNMTN